MGNKQIPVTGSVYLDQLTLHAVWKLLWIDGLTQVTVLEAIKPRQRFGYWLLRKKGVHIVEAEFFIGHLETAEGESVRRAARRMAGQLALSIAKGIGESEPQLRAFNEAYGRNTIRLFIAKQLYYHIDYWIDRAMVSQVLSGGVPVLWIKKPIRFDPKFICEAFPKIDLRFYPELGLGPVKLVISWLVDLAREWKLTRASGESAQHTEPRRSGGGNPANGGAVLALQEDTIRFDQSLRGQPHWLDASDPANSFHTYVVKLSTLNFPVAEDELQLSQKGLTLLASSAFRAAAREKRKEKSLQPVRDAKWEAYRAVFRARGYAGRFFLLRVASLFRQAELIGAMALWLDIRVFLVRETYYSFCDAMQLVAPMLNITTIAYQYSNLPFVSPLMMSTADKFLLFSDMYQTFYNIDGIGPKEFLTTGYLYDGVANLVRERARNHREVLCRAGAKYVVCYFDESVQSNRWGLVSKEDHLGELQVLAKAVLADPTFGVVVKSQFMFNSPSQLYPEDELIQRAKSTGRFLELMKGARRNDIYPTEAALVADLCVGHKFGATAALEAAISGVRTILLNPHKTRALWDSVLADADIEYETMDLLMEEIVRYRAGIAAQALGDWTQILHHFDPYRDGEAVNRLRQVVRQSVLVVDFREVT